MPETAELSPRQRLVADIMQRAPMKVTNDGILMQASDITAMIGDALGHGVLDQARETYVMSTPGEPSPADADDFDATAGQDFMVESRTIVYGWKNNPVTGAFAVPHQDLNGQAEAMWFYEQQVARIGDDVPQHQPHITKVERMIRIVSPWHTVAVAEEPAKPLTPLDVARRAVDEAPQGADRAHAIVEALREAGMLVESKETKTRGVAAHLLLPGDVVRKIKGPHNDDIIVEREVIL